MRAINRLVIHCTATSPTAKIENIRNYWKAELGWKNPGYHDIIDARGNISGLLPFEKIANGAKGFNADSIHVAYIGGVTMSDTRPPRFVATDTRTDAQRVALAAYVIAFSKKFPNAEIVGHNELPGVAKACPSFNVELWLQNIGLTRTEK